MIIRRRAAVVFAALLVTLDRFTKYLVETSLPLHEPVPVLPFLAWYRTWNEGIAFSFLTFMDDRILAVLVGIIILYVMWLWRRTSRVRWLSQLGFALVIGGAIGNLFDRLFLGYVVDFILVHAGNWAFAIFNLADAFITVGAVAIILDEFIVSRNLPRSGKPASSSNPPRE